MALINCYRFEQPPNQDWVRSGGVFKIRAGGVASPQKLGFESFRLQRLLIGIGAEFAKLQSQFRGHVDAGMLNATIRGVVSDAGLVPADAPKTVAFGVDDLGTAKYVLRLLIVDHNVRADQALAVGVTADPSHGADCVSCGLPKKRPKMDPKVKSHSVIPASFWMAIVPSALAAVGVEKVVFSGKDEVLRNTMINAGNEAAGNYAKPGADAQAISMCSDCESRQADFSLLQRHQKAQRWLRERANQGKEAQVRTFVGAQFLPPTGIGDREEMIRLTYNVARRVAAAFERQIFAALDEHIKGLPPAAPAAVPTATRKRAIVHTTRFDSPEDQRAAMRKLVLPQAIESSARRANATWVGVTSLEARQWSARTSAKARQWVDHVSLKSGLEISWITHGIDHATPLKARLEEIGSAHAGRRAKTTWKGLHSEPPLSVYLAQNIDAYLQAVVELAVLFSGLTRHDATKDEKDKIIVG